MRGLLSVIIPSKTVANLVPCIAAIRAHEPKVRIDVIDDGLVLDRNACYAIYSQASITPGQKPFIFARNVNLGIQAAGDDDVILLNDDALLETPGGFTALQRVSQENPDYGIIGAVTNVTGQLLQRPMDIGLRVVPHFAFVCVFIPRTTIERVGLLDERYCLDYGVEDRDYCEAVRRAGLKCGVYDRCFVDHSKLTSSFRGDPHTPRSFARNWQLFQEKWGPTAL
jgi:GT2 family glycosyltransferase